MKSLLTPLAALIATIASSAAAATWSTPDGFLTITKPSETEFTEIPSPPPLVASWVSDDDTRRFAIMAFDIPPHIELSQASAEEGLAEEVGGPVTRLPTREIGGVTMWSMTAKNADVEITQSLLRNKGRVYKHMAASVGVEPDADTINAFFNSVQVTPSPADAAPAADEANEPRPEGGGIDLHALSKRAGGLGFTALLLLLIYRAVKKKAAYSQPQ